MKLKKVLVGTAALAVVLAGAGCTQGNAKTSDDIRVPSAAQTTTATQAPRTSAIPTPTPTTPKPTTPSSYTFGETVTWEKGVEVTVSAPAAYKPSKYVTVPSGTSPIVLTITLKNGGTEAFDPGLVYTTASSGSSEAESIFDSAAGLTGGPSTKVLPGKTVTWKEGFAVLNPADVTVEITPGMSYDSAIFTS
jgi:hypothetical protein